MWSMRYENKEEKKKKTQKPADADGRWERLERVHELVHEILYPVDLHRALFGV